MRTTKIFKTVEKLAIITFAFWLIETIVFLFIYGWHIKATQEPEIVCDLIVVLLFDITIGIAIVAVWETIKQVSSFFAGGNIEINVDSDKIKINE